MECNEHDKCYEDGAVLTSEPAQIRWVCRKCLKTGTDIIGASSMRGREYQDLINKKNDK